MRTRPVLQTIPDELANNVGVETNLDGLSVATLPSGLTVMDGLSAKGLWVSGSFRRRFLGTRAAIPRQIGHANSPQGRQVTDGNQLPVVPEEERSLKLVIPNHGEPYEGYAGNTFDGLLASMVIVEHSAVHGVPRGPIMSRIFFPAQTQRRFFTIRDSNPVLVNVNPGNQPDTGNLLFVRSTTDKFQS